MGSAWKEPMGRVVTLVKGAMLTTIAGNTFLLSNNREPIIIDLSSSEQKLELASVYSEVCGGIVESQPDEVLVSLTIPFTSPSQHFVAYKQSKRRDDDIAIVNSAFWLDLQAGAVKQIRIAFGGVAPVTKLALETCSALKGEQWSRDLVDKAAGALLLEFPLPPDVPGAMVRYRQSLILR